ncbi:MAG: adenylyltransferase/cytidyltransferase family protein [Sandaracinaceae bacterium]|nr:adenylyltransferase/cytidyltransferase family protein [Sandaracinaceae bacterium]
MKTILTYGTFDLLHVGHVRLLNRARALGGRLIVGLSTDEFNSEMKGKRTVIPYDERKEILESLSSVDLVIPESTWEQKPLDIGAHGVHTFCMGDDWEGKFDELREFCEVVYLPRTKDISTTLVRQQVRTGSPTRDREAQ